jgi:hypothetical protein
VKNSASYKTFQTRLRIQRLVLKRLPIDRTSSGSFSRMPRMQQEIVWCMMYVACWRSWKSSVLRALL